MTAKTAIDRRRYLTLLWFFARTAAHAVWHDLVLRLPVLRLARREPVARWCVIARRYRGLAVRLGGVLIKLGQFLSTRVDVLPVAVTEELQGLQDEVPPADTDAIIRQIEDDFGQPIGAIFQRFERDSLAAASLAQAHAAALLDGTPVVVKALRPGIDVVVETDLKVIGSAIRALKLWRFVRRRIDLDALADEFAKTTRAELDMCQEAVHAERFAEGFRALPQIRIPRVYLEQTSRRTLTEENVAGIRITDLARLDEAGVDRSALARVVYRATMEQLFVQHFVHADPHPGNLFVRVLEEAPPGADIGRGVPFEVTMVDFGMVAEIPERLRAALRRYVLAFGNRDAEGMVDAYRDMGILLPGADREQLVEAIETVLERFWGVGMSDLSGRVRDEAAGLLLQFRHLLAETPVQVQVELLFANRALELVLGLVTSLDPAFDPWQQTVPFTKRLADDGPSAWADRLRDHASRLARLPADAGDVLRRARRGKLVVKSAFAPDAERQIRSVERAVDRLGLAVLAAGLLIAGALLAGDNPFGIIVMGLGVVLAAWVLLRGVVRGLLGR